MDERACSLCTSTHPFDALSSPTQCTSLRNLLQPSPPAWPDQAQPSVTSWLQSAGRGKFASTLLPHSPSNDLERVQDVRGLSDLLRDTLLFARHVPPNHAHKDSVNHLGPRHNLGPKQCPPVSLIPTAPLLFNFSPQTEKETRTPIRHPKNSRGRSLIQGPDYPPHQ